MAFEIWQKNVVGQGTSLHYYILGKKIFLKEVSEEEYLNPNTDFKIEEYEHCEAFVGMFKSKSYTIFDLNTDTYKMDSIGPFQRVGSTHFAYVKYLAQEVHYFKLVAFLG